ncbi:MAG: hypothetical protein RBS17_07480 [Coriobacteriia bacterium]|nr:hypothetical protein [Coriobacteriia bacterium]
MSTRGIIEKWHSIFSNYAQHGYTAAVHARDFEEIRDDLAIALEEIALMEAVCEAEDNGTDDELTTAGAALTAYRKECGL